MTILSETFFILCIMAKKSTNYRTVDMYRSAKTGRTVTKEYAEHHPATTVHEHRLVPKR